MLEIKLIREVNKIGLIALVAALIIAQLIAIPAAAQTETPQPTPTALTDTDHYNIDGRDLVIEHSVSLGDMAIVIGLLLIAGILTVYATFKIITQYLR